LENSKGVTSAAGSTDELSVVGSNGETSAAGSTDQTSVVDSTDQTSVVDSTDQTSDNLGNNLADGKLVVLYGVYLVKHSLA